MPNGILTLALASAMQVGAPGPSETPNYPALMNSNTHYGFEGQYEQRFAFDSQQNWTHGYFQEIPAYHGHAFFRPYNYKDVLSQSQVSAGWGQSAALPYSQQFWHKYQDQGAMLKLTEAEGQLLQTPAATGQVIYTEENPVLAQPVSGSSALPTPLPYPAVPRSFPAQPSAMRSTPASLKGPGLQTNAGPQLVNPATYAPR